MLLTLIVGLAVGWWLNDRESQRELLRLRAENIALKKDPYVVSRLIEAAQASDSKFEKLVLIEVAKRALWILEPQYETSGQSRTEYKELYHGIARVRRDVHRDRRLNEALIAIRQARADGDLTKATEIKTQLFMEYPDLTGDARLKE